MIIITPISSIAYSFVHFFGKNYRSEAMIAIGVYWVILTAAFEFAFGHYVVGVSWEKLLADYDILNNRRWVLVLITTLLAPLLCNHLIEK